MEYRDQGWILRDLQWDYKGYDIKLKIRGHKDVWSEGCALGRLIILEG